MDIRTGNGFDVHAFGPGDARHALRRRLPFDRGLVGHSDADVGLHALTDAIFGALGRGRHRPVVPALGPGLEGRGLGDLPAQGRRARRRPRLRHHPSRLHAGLRGAEDRPARRGDARRARRASPASTPTGSASRRPPPSGSASPAAARASPRSPPPRWCGRDAASIATFGYVGLLPGPAGTWGSLAALPLGYLLHWLGGFPLLARRRRSSPTALGFWATRVETFEQRRPRPGAHRHRRGRRPVDRALAALARPLAARARRRTLFPWPGWVFGFLLFRLFDIWKPGPVGWADRRKGPTGVMLDDVLAGAARRGRRHADGRRSRTGG